MSPMVLANVAGGVLPADEQLPEGSDLWTAHSSRKNSSAWTILRVRSESRLCVATPLEFALYLRKTAIAKASVGMNHSFE